MARMLCRCGTCMSTTVSPSPNMINVYSEDDVNNALAYNPIITLHDFLTDWDGLKDEPRYYNLS